MSDITIEKTHIKFVPAPTEPKRKTKIWWVVEKYGNTQLGTIAWFPRWRKYSFYPKGDTVYEWVCLKDIADFCEDQTKLHRLLKKKEKRIEKKSVQKVEEDHRTCGFDWSCGNCTRNSCVLDDR